MKMIFHVILAVLLLAADAICSFIRLGQEGNVLSIVSSRQNHAVELMFTIKASQGTSIKMFSEALSPSGGLHTLKMGRLGVEVSPAMDSQTLIWNSYHDGAYYLAFDHEFSGDLNFLPIQIETDEQTIEMMLPTFKHPMFLVSQNSFLSCHDNLISVQIAGDDSIHVSIFSETKSWNWLPNRNWDQEWIEYDGNIYYGQATRTDKNSPIIIELKDNMFCEFGLEELKPSSSALDPSKYYTFRDILNWAPKIQPISRDNNNQEL